MRKFNFITYLISAVFATIFVFAATGYNIINYCCSHCEDKGIDFIAHHSCLSVHHEDVAPCCSDTQTQHVNHFGMLADISTVNQCGHDNSCEVNRIHVDDFSVAERMVLAAFNFDLTNIGVVERQIYNSLDKFFVKYTANPPPDFSLPDGREILANKAVLII